MVATAAAALVVGIYAFINRRLLKASATQTYNLMTTGNYFTLDELTYSDTAKNQKIDNTPTASAREWLTKLIPYLNKIRELYGSAITVSSGYRCSTLNTAVGGSPTSQHVEGQAADLVPANGAAADVGKIFLAALKVGGYNQLIYEHNKITGSRWVHFAIANNPKLEVLAYVKDHNGKRYYTLANPATDYLKYA